MATKEDEGGLAPLLIVGGLLVGLWYLAKNRATTTTVLPGATAATTTTPGYTGTGATSGELNPALQQIGLTAAEQAAASALTTAINTAGTAGTNF